MDCRVFVLTQVAVYIVVCKTMLTNGNLHVVDVSKCGVDADLAHLHSLYHSKG